MSANGKQEATAATKEEFVEFFPQIVRDLTNDELHSPEVADAVARLKEVIEYNAVGGKYNRGLTIVSAFRELAGPGQQDQKSLQRALVVGWCVELMNLFV
uniref:Uncharacterized protein n=1 Tax=Sphaerodactylus townsendi TaxID=933632 RepID=A0ACB8G8F3_9SAUR